jgi:hypothetical protein
VDHGGYKRRQMASGEGREVIISFYLIAYGLFRASRFTKVLKKC